ncbi:amino acid--[acyl-carrier-protein] ligase [Frondihabitans cladoniiphilus]|uniref:Amino acid--[acyl-carrier-protein] ligase n=1 Tax=Frondihabitans cladoniiphilus TaxID=715785 RepID=A0ABP8W438_9MICO
MTDTLTQTSALDSARDAFRAEILDTKWLVAAGEPGLYARSGRFEDAVEGVARFVQTRFADLDAARLRFAPVFPRAEFEQTDYIVSFPHLTGAINGFQGTEAEHKQLVNARANGEQWDSWLSPAETMLVPAVCHPLYERLRGTLPEGGQVFDLEGFCFRHEPSRDPMRLQAFRQHELVFVGADEDARTFRNDMAARQLEGLLELGLDAKTVAANDPFFGRTGRFLARNQLADEAKLEIVVPIYGDLDEGTAIASANRHGDHFGATFGIETAEGDAAHSACLGWGLERVVLALVRTHGTDLKTWPTEVLDLLALDR